MSEKNLFQNVLKSFRVRMGDAWTQETTATEIDVSRTLYNAWENGRVMPTQLQLKRIAIVLELNAVEEDILYRAAASIVPRLHNLPAQKGLFIGRDGYLEQIAVAFAEQKPQPNTYTNLSYEAPEDPLQALREAAMRKTETQGRSIMISGLGGIGKTQLALAYAYQCYQKGTYRAVFWIDAGSSSAVAASFKSIERLLAFPTPSKPKKLTSNQVVVSTRTAMYSVNRWLAEHPDWLMVIDDLDLENMPFHLPDAPHGDLLITSQSQIVYGSGIRARIGLEEFKRDEAVYLLLRRCGLLSPQAALETLSPDIYAGALWLVLMLGGHALALDQAGTYIEESGITLLEYIQLFHDQYQVLLSTYSLSGAIHQSHPETVASTIMLSFKKAATLNPKAADILYFCACLSPDEVFEEILAQDADLWPDTVSFHAAISALRRYSLIERNVEHKSYSMHRIVQTVISSTISPEQTLLWRRRVAHAFRLASDGMNEEEHEDEWERLGPAVQRIYDWEPDDDAGYMDDVRALQERFARG